MKPQLWQILEWIDTVQDLAKKAFEVKEAQP